MPLPSFRSHRVKNWLASFQAASSRFEKLTNVGPAPPASFTVGQPFNGATYLSLTTTATFSGPVKIAIEYDPSKLNIQASFELIGTNGRRVPTQLYNGYGEQVAGLYTSLQSERLYM